MKEIIRAFQGNKLIGSIETKSNGDVLVRDFTGKILGKYCKSDNTTRNFYGQIVAYGNIAAGFLLQEI